MEIEKEEMYDTTSELSETLIPTEEYIYDEKENEGNSLIFPIQPRLPYQEKDWIQKDIYMKELKGIEDIYKTNNQMSSELKESLKLNELIQEPINIEMIENQPTNEIEGPIINMYQPDEIEITKVNNKRITQMEEDEDEYVKTEKGNDLDEKSQNTLDQITAASVSKYLDLNSIINLSKTTKLFKEMPEMLHFNPSTITTQKQRNIFKNVETWYVYSDSCGRMEKDFKIINTKKTPIKSIRMEDPMDINEGKRFLQKHSTLEAKVQWKENLVMDSKTNTKENRIRRNRLLDENTTELIEPIKCNKQLRILDLGRSKLQFIPSTTFHMFTSLERVILPPTIQRLGNDCFSMCTSLKEINLPTSIIHLGSSCFSDCRRLSIVSLPPYLEDMGDHCFYQSAIRSCYIPPLLKTLQESTFQGCTYLSKVEFNVGRLQNIDNLCFDSCEDLKTINIPDTVTSLGSSCFSGCNQLTSVHLPSTIKVLKPKTFKYCPIKIINIPTTIEEIGLECFFTWLRLSKIELPQTNHPIILGKDWNKGHFLINTNKKSNPNEINK